MRTRSLPTALLALTGDLDIWIQATPENAARVLQALKTFGAALFDLLDIELLPPER